MLLMKPSEALAAHRDELRELVSLHGLMRPRVYGSVLTGTDDDESDLDLLVDATEQQPCLHSQGWNMPRKNCSASACRF